MTSAPPRPTSTFPSTSKLSTLYHICPAISDSPAVYPLIMIGPWVRQVYAACMITNQPRLYARMHGRGRVLLVFVLFMFAFFEYPLPIGFNRLPSRNPTRCCGLSQPTVMLPTPDTRPPPSPSLPFSGSNNDSFELLQANSTSHCGHRVGIAHTRWATHGECVRVRGGGAKRGSAWVSRGGGGK